MSTKVIKAGNPSVKSLKLISSTEEAINTPTMIRAGAVAALGIMVANGEINSASRKQNAGGDGR